MKKTKNFIKSHKIASVIIAVIILGGGYWTYSKYSAAPTATRYVLAHPTTGTIESVVTGSGQVSSSNTIELKAKASGDLSSISVITGQDVKAGQLIASLDTRDALIDLENARLTYQKLVKPADASAVSQAQNSLLTAEQSLANSKADLLEAYTNVFSSMANVFLETPTTLTGLHNILSESTLSDEDARSTSQAAWDYRTQAFNAFYRAESAYQSQNKVFTALNVNSDKEVLSSAASGTIDMLSLLSAAVKDVNTFVSYMSRESTSQNAFSTELNSISTYSKSVNENISSLTSAKNSIISTQNAIVSSERQILEKTQSLEELRRGPDSLDLKSGELALQQKQRAYENYFIRAPFDGVIAKVSAKPFDSVSSGTSIATLISKQWISDISLNEVDVAKVAVGQPVKLTFDAIDGLTVIGKVTDVDLIGTVTQGVVNYTVEVGFDAKDPSIKSGMSVSATITTETKPNVLTVPNAAVKTLGNRQYVETIDGVTAPTEQNDQSIARSQGVASAQAPRKIFITTGLADDTRTEVIDGIGANDSIIVRTISGTVAKAATTQTPSLFGGARVGGNAVRATGGNAR